MARGRLIPFTEYTNPDYEAAEHHHLIADKLEAVERGEIRRLMIFMPPRHGKSELASRRFPAWFIGRNPRNQIVAASYSGDLASDFGREVRNIVAGEEYRRLFNVGLSADSQAANRWHTDQGGIYVAAGIGGPVTGRGAHVALIDDPIKDREEADSETFRNRAWNWYTSTLRTRLMPGGAIVLIQTRWHEDDLAGRLLDKMSKGNGEQWEVLSLPALRDGKALWPEWYDVPELEALKNGIQIRDWSALYQQEPTPEDGAYFKREWLRWYEEEPQHLRIYGVSDYAVTEDGGDYTVHMVFGVDPLGTIYILDLWRGQTDSLVWVETLCDLIRKWKPVEWLEEAGQIAKGVGPFISRRQRERKAFCYRSQYASAADKPTRAQAIRGRLAQGMVYLPSDAEWVGDLVSEMMRFPASMNDDQIDCLSLIGRRLAKLAPATVVDPKEPPRSETELSFNEMVERKRRKRVSEDV